jgi:hypothetical protein
MYIVGSWLLYACGGSVVGVFINGALELLQELVDVQKIALGPQVGQRKGIGVHRRMRWMRDHSAAATATVLRHATLVAANDGKLNALETHEPLADIVVGGRVNGAPLGITKELVQSVISGALSDFVRVVVQLLGLVDSIVNRSVGRVLRGSSVETCGSTSRVLLAVAGIRAHRPIAGIVSTRCSGKRLQVSDYCATQVRLERK